MWANSVLTRPFYWGVARAVNSKVAFIIHYFLFATFSNNKFSPALLHCINFISLSCFFHLWNSFDAQLTILTLVTWNVLALSLDNSSTIMYQFYFPMNFNPLGFLILLWSMQTRLLGSAAFKLINSFSIALYLAFAIW